MFRKTMRPLAGIVLGVVFGTSVSMAAHADHGTGWHHHGHYQNGSGTYTQRWRAHGAATGGDNKIDFYGARVWAYDPSGTKFSDMTASCGQVNEGCSADFYSPYTSWFNTFNGDNTIYMHICAYDDSHTLPGQLNAMSGPCAGIVPADVHTYIA